MPFINYKNADKKFEVPNESNILRVSLRYEGDLPNRCGGGYCGTCLVKIEEGAENVDKIKPAEVKKLGEELLEQGYRLGCQSFITGDVTVSWDDALTKEVQRRKVKVNK
ncbi:2Fe-2S iron-sulfur cluster-binding protein [Anaerobacillus sp. MEB173]|uniref:2Fe-2S iron-sulfur cluster-binding protein n=1 Tax=Anaerobacillus sp. MEB173 TaxID=3383345 RepID=UPI003F8E13F8